MNDNQKSVIDFALEYENFVENFNDWVESEIKKYDKAMLYDGAVLDKTVSYDKVYQGILLPSIYVVFFDDEIMLSYRFGYRA